MAVTEDARKRRAAEKRRGKKYSVTLPESLAEEISERVGPDEVSAYVIEVLERQAERDRITELIDDYERENGPLPKEYVDEAAEVFRRAEQREASWRAKHL